MYFATKAFTNFTQPQCHLYFPSAVKHCKDTLPYVAFVVLFKVKWKILGELVECNRRKKRQQRKTLLNRLHQFVLYVGSFDQIKRRCCYSVSGQNKKLDNRTLQFSTLIPWSCHIYATYIPLIDQFSNEDEQRAWARGREWGGPEDDR